VRIEAKYDRLVPVSELKPFDRNRNVHTPEQIKRLAYLMRELGVRAPVVIANAPWDCIAKGHGTVEAFRENGWSEVPCVFQNFKDYDELYQYVQSDNAIAEWAFLDKGSINRDLPDLGPFDINLLGIQYFEVDPADKDWDGMPEFNQEDETAYQKIYIHFFDKEGVRAFSELINQSITDKTKSIWYPQRQIGKTVDKTYSAD
jgi:hypothetical protein